MATQAIRQKLRSGGVSWGAWLLLGSPAAAEVMAGLGYDWLIIDGEHTAVSMPQLQLMLQAMSGSDTLPILRVPSQDRAQVKVALDVGVKGIMFPMVNSREQAIDAVRACKYPPEGVRGVGPGRASGYGLRGADYVRLANDEVLVLAIIEHADALAHLEEIVTVPGIDAFFFGFADYAASIGLTGQADHPRVREVRDAVLAATRRAGVPAAYAARDAAHAGELIQMGFRFLSLGSDAGLMAGAADAALEGARH